jgi:hypothetical protein
LTVVVFNKSSKPNHLYQREKHIVADTFLSYGYACTEWECKHVSRVLHVSVYRPKLVVKKNWWRGAGQMLASLLMA